MISSKRLKRFIRHVCIVVKHHYDREHARNDLKAHINASLNSKKREIDIELLNRKIDVLLEKEAKVAELGLKKDVPLSVQKKITFLQKEFELLRQDKESLLKENEEMRKLLESGPAQTNPKAEVKIEEKYSKEIIAELKEKIQLLEASYKKISFDKNIGAKRLNEVKDKINSYRAQLAKLSL